WVGEIGLVGGMGLDVMKGVAWVEDYAMGPAQAADRPDPAGVTQGIRFEHVTFSYPGSDRPALRDVDLFLPAGSIVAIVGENGAGKTTLVKLLAKLYAPTSGRILIDNVDLARIDAPQWRDRLARALPHLFPPP